MNASALLRAKSQRENAHNSNAHNVTIITQRISSSEHFGVNLSAYLHKLTLSKTNTLDMIRPQYSSKCPLHVMNKWVATTVQGHRDANLSVCYPCFSLGKIRTNEAKYVHARHHEPTVPTLILGSRGYRSHNAFVPWATIPCRGGAVPPVLWRSTCVSR